MPDVFALLFLAGDTYINGKVNRVFLTATLLLIASGPIQMAIARTDAWMQFATWLTTL